MSPLLGTLTGPALLIVGFVLALLAGVWVARRLLLDRQTRKMTKRAELWSGLLILFGVCLPQIALLVANLNDREWATTGWDWVWLTALAAFSLFNVWRLPALWRAARNEVPVARQERPAKPATLMFQLLLIVLPVVGLSVVGLVSLARDRAAVEAAARRAAEEIAQELAAKLGTAWPGHLGEIELAGNVWVGDGVVGGASVHWPGEVPGDSDPNRVAETMFARGTRFFSSPPEEVLPVQLRLREDGLAWPPPYRLVPQPPQWCRQLTNEPAAAWERLRTAELESPTAVSAAVAAVSAATREQAPNRLAEFLALRHAAEAGSNVVTALLKLGQRSVDDRCETELGLPLGVVALAEAGRRAPTAALDRDWFQLIRGLTLTQPSMLTSWVLDLGDRLARRTGAAEDVRRVAELKARWRATERLRGLSRDLVGAGQSNAGVLENRWFTNATGAWFAAMQPTELIQNTFEAGRRFRITNQETLVRLYTEDILARTAFSALHTVAIINGRERSTPPRVPTGMTLSLKLEGHALNVPAVRPVQDTPAPVLAEAAGEFRREGIMGETGERFDVWPSRPKFTVRVHLADSAALFVAQRRQQWIFGGMILVTAGVAGLGAWQMNRAFRRQLALNAEKSNFVASVSHELRTPLASLRLLAEGLAAGRVEEEPKRRAYAGFLVQETRRLGALVENVLDFARIEQGRKQYQFEPTDLGRLVTATVRLFEPLAAERRVRLELKLPAGPAELGGSLELNADGAALQQALVNLLDNALKHAPADSVVTVALENASAQRSADGHVRQQAEAVGKAGSLGELADVTVRAPQGWIRLSVSDAGPGIPPEDHERIFERFFRRGSELRRETQGVGLGLAIVKHIVAAHRGRVWVESQPGQGARFVVELPVGGTELPMTNHP
jgi:signal transduction histidine kinase